MQFTTKIPILKSEFPIDYDSSILSLGSCFAENMSDKFEYFKFRQAMNPFGIIFNPISIEKLIDRALKKELYTENDVFFYNERWSCYEVHSDVSCTDKEEIIQRLNQTLEEFNNQLFKATHIIITIGTAWVYRFIENNQIVANCHKVPQKQFGKELLTVETIKQSLENIVQLISNINPKGKFIFTISPVRHLKDGFVENQRSKAHLLTALHQILNPTSQLLNYFPSYEIMMDELRDYRFYANDMLHPSSVAVDYIWERFKETSISESAYKTMEEVSSIQNGLGHRSFNPNSESHLKFLANLQRKIDRLKEQFSFIRFQA